MTAPVIAITARPDAWQVLAEGLVTRRPVRAGYHGTSRLLCPHVLGWKNHRAKVLSYQLGAIDPPGQRWRSMFIDELQDATVLADPTWQTAPNYTTRSNGIDIVELAVTTPGTSLK